MTGRKKKHNGFGYEKPGEGGTNDWITPKHIIDAFDAQAMVLDRLLFTTFGGRQ